MLTIYFDACCLNRPFDDQTQARIRLESEAILLVLSGVEQGEWQWISSEVLEFELRQTPDPERRRRTLTLAQQASTVVRITPEMEQRGTVLAALDSAPTTHSIWLPRSTRRPTCS